MPGLQVYMLFVERQIVSKGKTNQTKKKRQQQGHRLLRSASRAETWMTLSVPLIPLKSVFCQASPSQT